MHRRSLIALAALAAPAVARAQSFPDRVITLVSGFAPGGSTDITARLLADRMQGQLGPNARIVVENRPGASGTVAADWLRRQPADGYVLMLNEASSHALIPHAMQGGTRYNPMDDFTHVAVVANGPLIMVAKPNFPAANAAEAVQKLRAGPQDDLPYASSGVGSIPHFAAESIAVTLGLGGKFAHVPYRSGGLMVESIARGETAWGVAVLASAAAQVRDNRVRGIAITGLERFPAFPNIPTLAESGMPGFDIGNWFAVVGPPRMPAAVTDALNRAINSALRDQQLNERFLVAGITPYRRANAPADARAFFQSELDKFKGVVERTGVRMEA
ncbi:Bug family tripartite tricarboxylate transporter substrate binding protein [Neoroseomonas soli]|uniref:Tripartite tricarboxylate transporter substrate binding protein n=1 Tax=Neoroseomonas soli TaxID=1081025 RepID=A0A9X9WQW6_9PROT|nr:tripartite tricarboxylate transporter substrate binding protein [Neoroseomonas soli]MBR0669545.1 tripartite tricarboxylate transporter substrate binding protein [Neoroseomonas soli]